MKSKFQTPKIVIVNEISIGARIVKSYQDFFQAFFSCTIPQQNSQFYYKYKTYRFDLAR